MSTHCVSPVRCQEARDGQVGGWFTYRQHWDRLCGGCRHRAIRALEPRRREKAVSS